MQNEEDVCEGSERVKSPWEADQQTELEGLTKHLKQWWKGLKKLKVVDKRGTRSDVLKVRDMKGEVKEGEEAVWCGRITLRGF